MSDWEDLAIDSLRSDVYDMAEEMVKDGDVKLSDGVEALQDELHGNLYETIDRHIDIRTYDLFEYAKQHQERVDDILGGYSDFTTLTDIFIQAQAEHLGELANDMIGGIYQELVDSYGVEDEEEDEDEEPVSELVKEPVADKDVDGYKAFNEIKRMIL